MTEKKLKNEENKETKETENNQQLITLENKKLGRLERSLGKKKFNELNEAAISNSGFLSPDGQVNKHFSVTFDADMLIDIVCDRLESRENKINSLKKELKEYDKMKVCTKAGKCKYKSNPVDNIDVAECISRMIKSHFIIMKNPKLIKEKFTINEDLFIYAQLSTGVNPTNVFGSSVRNNSISYNAFLKHIKVIQEVYFPAILNSARTVASDVYGKDKYSYTAHILSIFLRCIIPAHISDDMINDTVTAIIVDVSNSSVSIRPDWKEWCSKLKNIDTKNITFEFLIPSLKIE